MPDKFKNLPTPTEVRVLEQYDDGKGHHVKVVQFYQGTLRVVQTISKPIGPKVVVHPIHIDSLQKDSVLVEVYKSKFRVDVFYRGQRIRSYPAVFGPKPMQDKCMEGDRCTPEGSFRIKHKNPKSQYHKFMLLDYPNDSSVAHFTHLKSNGKIPQHAKIGGNVGIHGVWDGGDDLIELGVGWTDGCVALKNKDVDELFRIAGVGTLVRILR